MVLEKLSHSLKEALQKVISSLFVDEKLIKELVKEIQKALLQADVDVHLVLDLTKKIEERALKERPPQGLTQREFLINLVYEELTNFLGKKAYEIETTKQPTKVMLIGLYGSGKSTQAAKLAKFYKKRGYHLALLQTDTWRPAAYQQLEQLSQQIGVDFYGIKDEKDSLKIYLRFEKELKKYDLVIIDTAGRDALNRELITEITRLNKEIKPEYCFLVIPADLGQTAKKQAESFQQNLRINGIIITKMEGTAKAGGALTACQTTKAPVYFIGLGEKIDDLELFNPQRFVSKLIGLGDLETLLEKAKEVISEEKAEDLKERFLSGKFNLIDLFEQMSSVKKMGSLRKLIEMIPGLSMMKLPEELLNVQEEKLEKWKTAMQSMTEEELENPEIINPSRIERIARGSGVSPSVIRELIKQFNLSKKLFKNLDERNLQKMLKRLGGKIPFST